MFRQLRCGLRPFDFTQDMRAQSSRGQSHLRIAEVAPLCVWRESSSGAAEISATNLLGERRMSAEAAVAGYISKVLFLQRLCDLIGAESLLWHGDC
jgi:hypothetical protein